MTPIEQVNQMKDNFLWKLKDFFQINEKIFSIEFIPEENELGIEPTILTRDGVLTCVDEFGNDDEDKIDVLSIEVVALILSLIQSKKYTVYERI